MSLFKGCELAIIISVPYYNKMSRFALASKSFSDCFFDRKYGSKEY